VQEVEVEAVEAMRGRAREAVERHAMAAAIAIVVRDAETTGECRQRDELGRSLAMEFEGPS
jgi:hypothetical protein